MDNKFCILLIQPHAGMAGAFVRHAPLSLLYASTEAVKQGIPVVLLDLRLHSTDWQQAVRAALKPNMLVGISVMTGYPVQHALEVGDFVKSVAPHTPVVWGGPFATFHPEYILRDAKSCDYVISGYGSRPLAALAKALKEHARPSGIPGLSYRTSVGEVLEPADWSCHEMIHWRDIPYHLIYDYSVYGQLDQKRIIFSMYSAMGCAYQCAFCSSPPLYRQIKGRRWVPLPVQDIADHIEHVVDAYDADYIYFIDDDSFVDINHVAAIIKEIKKRGIHVGLGFRGARVNEILRMDSAYIDALAAAGTDILHIGAETASDRLLRLVRKDCTVADILEINRKLAHHPQLFLFYNFIIGLPTETMDDLKALGRLWLTLVEEHPRCIIGTPNMLRPLPGTELFAMLVEMYGYAPPQHLLDYAKAEVENEAYAAPWMSADCARYANMLRVTSYFVDDKFNKVTEQKTLRSRAFGFLFKLYTPIARWRLRHGYADFFVEGYLYALGERLLRGKSNLLGV
ncbi:B12-binding domain-containing radical SAM protein [Desulfovibrio sp. OttesenSCG-928-G11]|nr:B12-binding domain-containing radical SAM protein [Desulfovibrio sp. OttesenSCG-928-G11]